MPQAADRETPRRRTARRRPGMEDEGKAEDPNNRKDREDSRGKDMGLRRREPGPRSRRTNRPKQNPATKTRKTRDFATPYVQVS